MIVQLAGFSEGELLLYERLQMTPMLLERYAQDGGDRARRHMLAMCRTDPEVLADVLGHFVAIASKRIQHVSSKISMRTVTDGCASVSHSSQISLLSRITWLTTRQKTRRKKRS